MQDVYYVYVDWTIDEPRPFYVGKGKIQRVRKLLRNRKHSAIANKHGQQRKIVLGPVSNECACAEEKRLIIELKTTNVMGGANFTQGGEGVSRSWTLEEKAKISKSWTQERKDAASKRMRESNPMKDKSVSDPVVMKLIAFHTGRKKSLEEIENCRQANLGSKNPAYGKPQSEEAKRKNAESNRKKALERSETKRQKRIQNVDVPD